MKNNEGQLTIPSSIVEDRFQSFPQEEDRFQSFPQEISKFRRERERERVGLIMVYNGIKK